MWILDLLKNLFLSEGEDGGKNNNLIRNIIIIGMIGTLLLLFGNVFVNTGNETTQPDVSSIREEKETFDEFDYEKRLTNELEEIISLMKGVGRVKVKIYGSRYPEYEYEYNSNRINKTTSENDQNGGERKIVEDNFESKLVIINDTSGNEKPVIKRKILPDIRGVLIVAQGAENSRIKYEIIKSVSSLLNIPIHRINVLPYERG